MINLAKTGKEEGVDEGGGKRIARGRTDVLLQ